MGWGGGGKGKGREEASRVASTEDAGRFRRGHTTRGSHLPWVTAFGTERYPLSPPDISPREPPPCYQPPISLCLLTYVSPDCVGSNFTNLDLGPNETQAQRSREHRGTEESVMVWGPTLSGLPHFLRGITTPNHMPTGPVGRGVLNPSGWGPGWHKSRSLETVD